MTFIIIALIVVISIWAWQDSLRLSRFMMNPYMIQNRKEYHRFLTSGLIHKDSLHLFFNMFTLYFFGSNIEKHWVYLYDNQGYLYYFGLFFGGIIISDIPTFLKNKNNPAYNSLGASGGVSAVVFASILYFPISDICLYAIFCLPGFILGSLFLIYSYYAGKKGGDTINHYAHFYGAVFGIGYAFFVQPTAIFSFWQQLSTWSFF